MSGGYVVNCSLLFGELPLPERASAARAAGFRAVEYWWPWPDTPVPSAGRVDAFCQSIEDARVRLAGLNFYAGDMPAGERGVVSDPSRATEFRASVEVLARIAERTGVRAFNALYGQRLPGVADTEQDRIATLNLAHAARTVGAFGGTVLIEPLARGLNGAYPLETAADAIDVVRRVRAEGPGNVKFLFDTFHLASNGEDLGKVIEAYAAEIGHVQVADVPGRGRPGTGTLDFDAILAALERHGYRGPIALEYTPQGPTDDTEFAWLKGAR
ncbi:MAG TPA: TIM barrel protein [Thermomonospora sp.]|nr:TIM barrel protein [Thermomonospora sp.]